MALRRGFKTEANWYARDVRRDLGLSLQAPICPWRLARHLEYKIVPLSDFRHEKSKEVDYLMSETGQGEFSAVSLYRSDLRWIIHNDAHELERQAANISHEVAHGLLLHPPAQLRDETGARTIDIEQEAEAHWLGPALLISEEAALHIVRTRMSNEVACEAYGVSNELLQMRLNVTGALIRAGRKRAA